MVVAATNALVFLAFLACPIAMGLMMLVMGRGMKGMGAGNDKRERPLDELKAEQARLAEKIEAFEARQEPARDPGPAAGTTPEVNAAERSSAVR